MTWKHFLPLAALAALALTACDNKSDGASKGDAAVADSSQAMAKLTKEELMDPEKCKECHARHYREWASSMHAYASKDPVFLAMNKRGQEETNNELGDFCVKCHAPLAVAMGLTENGLNLDEIDDKYKGITCYFCHNVQDVSDVHDNPLGIPANNPLELAMDDVMRGGMGAPGEEAINPPAVDSPAHKTEYSPHLDGGDLRSAKMCGACHDIVTPAGVHLERTYKEWQGSLVAQPENVGGANSCIDCHMHSRTGLAAETNKVELLPSRRNGVHSHLFPGVDVALTAHPDIELQKLAITCELAETLIPYEMTVEPNGLVTIWYDGGGLGHFWPSGATQDRRAFIRVRAFDADGNVVATIGDVGEDQSVMEAHAQEPRMAVLRDTMFDAQGNEVHMFWDAVSTEDDPRVVTSPSKGAVGQFGHAVPFDFQRVFTQEVPAQIEVEVYIRPLGREVIRDLLESGHLQQFGMDESIIDEIPTFPLHNARMVWDFDRDGFGTIRSEVGAAPLYQNCRKDLECMLDPSKCETE